MMGSKSFVFRFDDVEVREREFMLIKAGKVLTVEPKAFRALLFLLHNPQRLISKEELLNTVWRDAVVTEGSLTRCISLLRSLLGDDIHQPRYIATVATVGYRFVCKIDVSQDASGNLEATGEPDGFDWNDHVQAHANGGIAEAAVDPPGLTGNGAADEATSGRAEGGNRKRMRGWLLPCAAVLVVTLTAAIWYLRRPPPHVSGYIQITDFADGATSPALSPDGRMIAFIRGPETFVTSGQIYVKLLPDGQPVQLTHDDLAKMAPAFSPDGSRIAYTTTNANSGWNTSFPHQELSQEAANTTTDARFGWNTWVVQVLGGEPQLLLPNAAALTWADRQHVVFSEIRIYTMDVVTASESRAGERNVYLPPSVGGMAHRSWVSPDGKWILVSEMDGVGWRPCRVLPFDGSTRGETAGPRAASCTYAAWSPDGKTMYFSADAGDGYHIWRQRFLGGTLEQITFGATEEEGIAVSPDGQSLVTSAGIRESTVWLHDARGDRQISGEGFAIVPGLGNGNWIHSAFSPDGKRLYYLVRKQGSRAYISAELWMADSESGRTEALLPGVAMSEFDVAPNGKLVAFSAPDAEGHPHIWVAPLDRRTPPKQLTSFVARYPYFGPEGDLHFWTRDQEFVYSFGLDETAPRKSSSQPGAGCCALSPHGDLLLSGGGSRGTAIAEPIQGGPSIRICSSCSAAWGRDGKSLYIRFSDVGKMGGGKTIVIALPNGKELPKLPPSGFKSAEDVKGVNVVAEIDMKDKTIFAPGPDPSVYAYVRATVQRNLFRIPLQ